MFRIAPSVHRKHMWPSRLNAAPLPCDVLFHRGGGLGRGRNATESDYFAGLP